MNKDKMFGYFSAAACERYGSYIYLDIDNKEVEVTGIYLSKENAEENYAWDDKVFVNELIKPIRKGKSGSYYETPEADSGIFLELDYE